MENQKIDIHIDDYAISVNASKTILELVRQNKVNSISIIPNFECFSQCMSMLDKELSIYPIGKLKIAIHLNFMEGKSCASYKDVKNLVDEKGRLSASWGSLLLASYNPFIYKKVKNQLKQEIRFQIKQIRDNLSEDYKIRLDSHQHTHVIPIVFNALCEVIVEDKLNIEYIRIPKEPIFLFLRHTEFFNTYSLINLLKNLILNMYGTLAERKIRSWDIEYTIMWGILMSGNMDWNRVKNLLHDFQNYAYLKKRDLEILFHSGTVLPEEITSEYSKQGFTQFHLSKNRKIEWETVYNLGNEISNGIN
ncbi:MAG: ChbG/HpnK family deacetylase [Bacteroidales bacterium]|nr:ChbG/HpnK family deacetylase [Bacteroidales bacterium]